MTRSTTTARAAGCSAPKTTPAATSAPSAGPGPQDPPRRQKRSGAEPRSPERLEALLRSIDHDITNTASRSDRLPAPPRIPRPPGCRRPFADRRGPVPPAATREVGHRRRGRRSSWASGTEPDLLRHRRDRPHLRPVEDPFTTTDDGTLVEPGPRTQIEHVRQVRRRTSTASKPPALVRWVQAVPKHGRFQPHARRPGNSSKARIAITGPSGAARPTAISSPRPFRVMGAPSSSTAARLRVVVLRPVGLRRRRLERRPRPAPVGRRSPKRPPPTA